MSSRGAGYKPAKQTTPGPGSVDLKPPDLWIHHEQMELKNIGEKPTAESTASVSPIPRDCPDSKSLDDYPPGSMAGRRNSFISKWLWLALLFLPVSLGQHAVTWGKK